MSVSVVISSYNHAPYLRECIESALQQTLVPAEVFVVDDGSTDGSREIIRSFGDTVHPLFQENRGTYAALNAGIARTSGDWIAIHNSDDAWRLQKLERQMALAVQHPEVGLIHTDFICIHADGKPFSERPATMPDYHGPPVTDMHARLMHSMPIIISSVMVRRDVLGHVGPFHEAYHGTGDWDFCLRVSQDYPIGFVDEPLTLVRKHEDNSGTNPSRLPGRWQNIDWKLMCKQTFPKAARRLYERAQRDEIDRMEAVIALAANGVRTRRDDPALARRVLFLSARLRPQRLKTWLRLLAALLPQPTHNTANPAKENALVSRSRHD